MSKFVRAGGVALALSILGTGCAAATSSGPLPPRSGSAPPEQTPAVIAASAACAGGSWRAVPVSVTHSVGVPPVPVITGVRTARHPECGYDRMVIDVTGSMPSYSVRYVSRVTTDASGRAIALPGQRFLLITLRSAQAHSASGAPTVTRQLQVTGYSGLLGWVLAGDFEGVVTIAAALPSAASIRTGELPGHLYVDVRQ
ncbi:MAG: hypothetical protein J2P29_02440 [Actinobacteria bacterium]|nr:hypothetical protein [Actinomycetota bacterium]